VSISGWPETFGFLRTVPAYTKVLLIREKQMLARVVAIQKVIELKFGKKIPYFTMFCILKLI